MKTKKENKIAVRVKPLKKWSDVAQATKHGQREDASKHVDRERTKKNWHWQSRRSEKTGQLVLRPQGTGADIEEAFVFRAKENGAKWRKGAIVGTELMFIASPEFFLDKDDSRYEGHALKWAVDCITAASAKFPDMLAAARLDLDETTPHVSVFLLPTYEKTVTPRANKDGSRNKPRAPRKTISHNTLFGGSGDEGPEKLSALQDWAEEVMQAAGHDLKRGTRKLVKGRDHVTPAEGRRRIIAAAEEEAVKIVAEARQEALGALEDLTGQKAALEAELGTLRGEISAEQRQNDRYAAAAAENLKTLNGFPAPLRQAQANNDATGWAIEHVLQRLGIADSRPNIGYTGPDGDPPPIRELVFSLARQKARELVQALGLAGPTRR